MGVKIGFVALYFSMCMSLQNISRALTYGFLKYLIWTFSFPHKDSDSAVKCLIKYLWNVLYYCPCIY